MHMSASTSTVRRPPQLVASGPGAPRRSLRRPHPATRARRVLPLLGPAFVAAIAYVDPGNFATNFAGGSAFGYTLLWVIVVANLMAMLIQGLSAKLGLATGKNLAELCREHFPRRVSRGLWVQAEAVAMATDLAEVLGGALALHLLFGVPLLHGGLITGAVAFLLLAVHGRSQRRFERVITALLGIIIAGFAYQAIRVGADPGGLAAGLVPSFAGVDSVLLAAGILGATVMPHVVYLHSDLTRSGGPRRASGDAGSRYATAKDPASALRIQRLDVLIALGLAGLANAAMLIIAASLFFGSGMPGTDTIEGIHAGLGRLLDAPVALAFAVALLVSGLASSGVGTYAGQVVMQGFLRRSLPLVLRRGLTLAPALVVLAVGVDPTRALVLSQVVLSFGVPFALVPLVLLTRRRDVMGDLVNRRVTTVAAWAAATVVIGLNLFLLGRLVLG